MKIIKIYRFLAITGITIIFLFILFYALGYRINTTKSIPIGIYMITNKVPGKNDYVIFCPSDSSIFYEARKRGYIDIGFCPGNYGYMMKKIVAMEGDYVTISEKGVTVNNVFLPLSIPMKLDLQGNKLPQLNINSTLNKSEILLMSDVSTTSFDARYFGILNKQQIKHAIKPVLILGEKQ